MSSQDKDMVDLRIHRWAANALVSEAGDIGGHAKAEVKAAARKALRPKPPNQAQIQWLLDGSNGRADPGDFDCGDCGEVHDWIEWAIGELGDGQ